MHNVKWYDEETGIKHLTVIRADDLDELMVKVRTVTHLVKIARQKNQLAQDNGNTPEIPEGWCNIQQHADEAK